MENKTMKTAIKYTAAALTVIGFIAFELTTSDAAKYSFEQIVSIFN